MNRAVRVSIAIACLVPALAIAAPSRPGATNRRSARGAIAAEPLHLRVARAVFPREQWQRFMTEAATSLTKQIVETGKGQIELEPGFADRLREHYEELAPYEEMIEYQARVLGDQYSEAELKQLLAFYRTPLGKKSVPFVRDMIAASMQRAQISVSNGLADALAQLKPLVHRVPEANQNREESAEGGRPSGASASADGDSKTL